MPVVLLDAAGRCRSRATLPGFHCGRAPRNKGRRYPADPPTVEEIVAVMRQAGGGVDADRARGLIVVLWRAGLRISEALALLESDLDSRRGSILVRRGKAGSAGRSGWTRGGGSSSAVDGRSSAVANRRMFCVVHGSTAGRACSAPAVRSQLARLARQAGVRRRFAPHQLRHAHAVEMAREGVPLLVIQRASACVCSPYAEARV